MRLAGRVALVTGAARGIGLDVALGFAREGADVAVMGRSSEAIAAAAAAIGVLGRRSLPLTGDVTSKADAQAAVDQCVESFGRLDVLVNNAATQVRKSTVELSEEEWDLVLNTNLKGPFLMSQAASRVMLRQRSGSIINIGSIAGTVGIPGRAPYCASKGGLVLLTRALAAEWGPLGLRVNCLSPGYVRTERHKQLAHEGVFDDVLLQQNTALRRLAEPEEMVGPAIFLASDESSYIQGQDLMVDGGWVINSKVPAPTGSM